MKKQLGRFGWLVSLVVLFAFALPAKAVDSLSWVLRGDIGAIFWSYELNDNTGGTHRKFVLHRPMGAVPWVYDSAPSTQMTGYRFGFLLRDCGFADGSIFSEYSGYSDSTFYTRAVYKGHTDLLLHDPEEFMVSEESSGIIGGTRFRETSEVQGWQGMNLQPEVIGTQTFASGTRSCTAFMLYIDTTGSSPTSGWTSKLFVQIYGVDPSSGAEVFLTQQEIQWGYRNCLYFDVGWLNNGYPPVLKVLELKQSTNTN